MKVRTVVYAAGREFRCKESYEDIRAALTDGEMLVAEGSIHWKPPLELTVRDDGPGPEVTWRAMIQPHAIAAVVEV